ncbi:MAG: DUF2807 domain-containing protein [Alistipes sp.]|nr:DUF2807 domain-containing protein [Alistipes sp.]
MTMKNLFINPIILFATLLMWIFSSTTTSAQEVISVSPSAGSTVTIDGNVISIEGGGATVDISQDGDQIVQRKGGNIIINGRALEDIINDNDNYNADDYPRKIVGSKERSTRTIELAKDFNYIKASRGVEVVMSNEKGNKATISANSNLIDYVICKSSGGTLTVGVDDKVRNLSNFHVEITIPRRDNINVYQVASGASINIHPELTCPNVSMEVSSGGSVNCARINCDKLLIEASSAGSVSGSFRIKECGIVETSSAADINISALSPELNLKASSGSTINVSGQVKHLDVDASSAANIKAYNLNAVTAEAEASSGASVKLNCSKSLEAEASSAADIRYTGDCTVERRASSGGSVKKVY